MTDKKKLHQILLLLWKNDDSIGKTYYNQALQDVQTAIDLQEEPVSEKKCMFTKDSYTDKDRKVLCEDCKEKCEYSKKEEPISEVLDEAAFDYAESCKYEGGEKLLCIEHFKAGVDWKEQQFEKNRLAACDRQTEKEAEIERDFVMGIIENEHRYPTFDDAIKYGMRLQKEQMMANTADAMIGLPYENKDGGYTHLVDVSRPLPVGSNKIAIIFKED